MSLAARSLAARHVSVRGLVQGVAFRHYTKVRARELELCGWVRNLDDGSVEVWAQGEVGALEQLVAWLRHGPPTARVDAVEVREVPPQSHARFVVLREPG